MLNKGTIIKRLTIAKYLYKIAYEQSKLPESMAFASILGFHDAVEIFLKLAAENQNIKSDQFKFLQYWDHLPGLTLKESMNSLNQRRVNLKHKGILPAKLDLEISRVNVTDFFEQNTKHLFGLDFNEISLLSLVTSEEIRRYLEKSQTALDENKLDDSIENVAFAFFELLDSYEQNKRSIYHKSPFHFGEQINFWHSSLDSLKLIDRTLASNMNKMQQSV